MTNHDDGRYARIEIRVAPKTKAMLEKLAAESRSTTTALIVSLILDERERRNGGESPRMIFSPEIEKLSNAQVQEIRLSSEKGADLAIDFDVSEALISRIRSGQRRGGK